MRTGSPSHVFEMKQHEIEILGYGLFWLLFCLAAAWFVFVAIDRRMALAEVQGVDRLRAAVVKQRMRYHGARAARLAENGVWHFRDKEGRLCRL